MLVNTTSGDQLINSEYFFTSFDSNRFASQFLSGSHMRMTQLAHSRTLYFVFGLNESVSCPGLLASAEVACWHQWPISCSQCGHEVQLTNWSDEKIESEVRAKWLRGYSAAIRPEGVSDWLIQTETARLCTSSDMPSFYPSFFQTAQTKVVILIHSTTLQLNTKLAFASSPDKSFFHSFSLGQSVIDIVLSMLIWLWQAPTGPCAASRVLRCWSQPGCVHWRASAERGGIFCLLNQTAFTLALL